MMCRHGKQEALANRSWCRAEGVHPAAFVHLLNRSPRLHSDGTLASHHPSGLDDLRAGRPHLLL
eukprot:14586381-Heterocapsa_arctica.AAC.1